MSNLKKGCNDFKGDVMRASEGKAHSRNASHIVEIKIG